MNTSTSRPTLGLWLRMATATLSATSLSGCVALPWFVTPVLVGTAATTGVLVVTDRRTSGTQLEDQGIEMKASGRVQQAFPSPPSPPVHVNITSYNRQVLLTGEVPNQGDKAKVEALVKAVDNVQSVVNELAVRENTGMQSRTEDSLITARVKAAFVNDKTLFANAFKVVTERGTVYLMGRVTEQEAQSAAEVARHQRGVLKVVRVVEIISEEEKERLSPKPSPQVEPPGPTPVLSGSGTPWNAAPR